MAVKMMSSAKHVEVVDTTIRKDDVVDVVKADPAAVEIGWHMARLQNSFHTGNWQTHRVLTCVVSGDGQVWLCPTRRPSSSTSGMTSEPSGQ